MVFQLINRLSPMVSADCGAFRLLTQSRFFTYVGISFLEGVDGRLDASAAYGVAGFLIEVRRVLLVSDSGFDTPLFLRPLAAGLGSAHEDGTPMCLPH